MRIETSKVTHIELTRDEAVKLRRVLDTGVYPTYDEEGRKLAADISTALTQQLYYPEVEEAR